MYIRTSGPLRPLSRGKIVLLLATGLAAGLAALLAFAGVGPFPARNADELAGIALGVLGLLAAWVGARRTNRS